MIFQALNQSFGFELLADGVSGFGDAVGIEDESVAGVHFNFAIVIDFLGHDAEEEALSEEWSDFVRFGIEE